MSDLPPNLESVDDLPRGHHEQVYFTYGKYQYLLENEHVETRPREVTRGHQPIVAGTNDDDVMPFASCHAFPPGRSTGFLMGRSG